MRQFGTLALGLAVILEATLAFGVGLATPGHDLLRHYVSTLGATGQPYAGLVLVLGLGAAVAHGGLAVILVSHAPDRTTRVRAALLVAFFVTLGIGLLFQCDPGCALETQEAVTHYVFGVTAFALLGVAALLGLVQAIAAGDLLQGAAALAVVACDVALLASDAAGLLRGLTERATLVAVMCWSVAWLAATFPAAGRRLSPGGVDA